MPKTGVPLPQSEAFDRLARQGVSIERLKRFIKADIRNRLKWRRAAAAMIAVAVLLGAVRVLPVRRLHLFRPDLLSLPLQVESYC